MEIYYGYMITWTEQVHDFVIEYFKTAESLTEKAARKVGGYNIILKSNIVYIYELTEKSDDIILTDPGIACAYLINNKTIMEFFTGLFDKLIAHLRKIGIPYTNVNFGWACKLIKK